MQPMINDINKFIWTRPEIITELSRGGQRPYTSFGDVNCPVYPYNEQPESDAPYVVYNYRPMVGKDYWKKEEELYFQIWDYDISRLQRIEMQVIRYLSQYDVSAEAFMFWAVNNQIPIKNRPFIIHMMDSEDVVPQDQEGGVVGRTLIFKSCHDPCDNLEALDISVPS